MGYRFKATATYQFKSGTLDLIVPEGVVISSPFVILEEPAINEIKHTAVFQQNNFKKWFEGGGDAITTTTPGPVTTSTTTTTPGPTSTTTTAAPTTTTAAPTTTTAAPTTTTASPTTTTHSGVAAYYIATPSSGTNNVLRWTAATPGAAGNNITVEYASSTRGTYITLSNNTDIKVWVTAETYAYDIETCVLRPYRFALGKLSGEEGNLPDDMDFVPYGSLGGVAGDYMYVNGNGVPIGAGGTGTFKVTLDGTNHWILAPIDEEDLRQWSASASNTEYGGFDYANDWNPVDGTGATGIAELSVVNHLDSLVVVTVESETDTDLVTTIAKTNLSNGSD